jgi:hypothetical protein
MITDVGGRVVPTTARIRRSTSQREEPDPRRADPVRWSYLPDRRPPATVRGAAWPCDGQPGLKPPARCRLQSPSPWPRRLRPRCSCTAARPTGLRLSAMTNESDSRTYRTR